jgi:hypothetical protein
MTITVIVNSIPRPDKRAAIEAAVRAGIGNRLGDWQVEILTRIPERAGFDINVLGPELKKWSRGFETPDEEHPEFVQKAIQAGTI